MNTRGAKTNTSAEPDEFDKKIYDAKIAELTAENATLRKKIDALSAELDACKNDLTAKIDVGLDEHKNKIAELEAFVKHQREMNMRLLSRVPDHDPMQEQSMQNSVHGPAGAAAAPEASEYASARAGPATPATPSSANVGRGGTYAAVAGAAAARGTTQQLQHAPGTTQAPTDPTAQGLDVLLQTFDAQQAKEFKNDPARTTAIAVQNLLRRLTGVRVAVAGARVLPPGKPRAGTAAGSGVRVLVTLQTLNDKLNVVEHRKQLQQWHVRSWRTEDEQRRYVQLLKDHSKGLAEAKAAGRWARPTLDYKKMRVQVDGQWIDMQPDAQPNAQRAAGAGAGGGGVAAPAAAPAGGEQ